MGTDDTRAGVVNRRELLKQAAAMAPVSVFPSWSLSEAQTDGQDSLPRIRENFDQAWKFLKGDPAGAQEPGFSDAAWKTLDLPHDWSIEGPFNEKEPADGNGAYLPTGIGWYRKRFLVPSSQKDRTPKRTVSRCGSEAYRIRPHPQRSSPEFPSLPIPK